MKRRNVSSRLNYGNLFEGWEIAIAKALVGEFCGDGKDLPPEDRKAFPWDEFDDLLQDVLTHWYFTRDTWEPGKGASEKTYMRTVIRRKLLDLRDARGTDKRKALDKAESFETPIGEDEDGPNLGETVVDRKRMPVDTLVHLCIELSPILHGLTPRQREVLELKVEKGLNHVEIAERLGVHRDTVQADVRRIQKLFKDTGLNAYLA